MSPAEKARIRTLKLWVVVPSLVGGVGSVILYFLAVTPNAAKWLVMAKEHLASLVAFFFGLLLLVLLFSWAVSRIIQYFHHEGGTSEPSAKIQEIALSSSIAIIEQVLFYFAAIAGREVFGLVAGGWLVFKAVNKYVRWEGPTVEPPEPDESAKPEEEAKWKAALKSYHYKAAIAHNTFQIFAIGTAMSIAAGGIAGVAYHYLLCLLKHP